MKQILSNISYIYLVSTQKSLFRTDLVEILLEMFLSESVFFKNIFRGIFYQVFFQKKCYKLFFIFLKVFLKFCQTSIFFIKKNTF